MLTDANIADGIARNASINNINGPYKLSPTDVDSWVQNLRLLVGSLEEDKNYRFEEDISALDDSDGRNRAAKFAGALILLNNDGFDQLNLTGKNGVALSLEEKRDVIRLWCFSLIYKIPVELSVTNEILRYSLLTKKASKSYGVVVEWQ